MPKRPPGREAHTAKRHPGKSGYVDFTRRFKGQSHTYFVESNLSHVSSAPPETRRRGTRRSWIVKINGSARKHFTAMKDLVPYMDEATRCDLELRKHGLDVDWDAVIHGGPRSRLALYVNRDGERLTKVELHTDDPVPSTEVLRLAVGSVIATITDTRHPWHTAVLESRGSTPRNRRGR